MVELKNQVCHNDEYDININRYLTYAQIQQIVGAVVGVDKNDFWAGRQTNIDMLVLFHATDIGKDKLEKIGHETLLCSGLIKAVNDTVENLYQVYEGIEFAESTNRAGIKFLTQLSKLVNSEQFSSLLKKYGKTSKK